MKQYDFEKIERMSEKTNDTIEKLIDELEIAEIERTIYKNLLKALVRSERLDAAVKTQEFYVKARCNQ